MWKTIFIEGFLVKQIEHKRGTLLLYMYYSKLTNYAVLLFTRVLFQTMR